MIELSDIASAAEAIDPRVSAIIINNCLIVTSRRSRIKATVEIAGRTNEPIVSFLNVRSSLDHKIVSVIMTKIALDMSKGEAIKMVAVTPSLAD